MNMTFFDVETPNRRNDSICSIGVVRTNGSGLIEYKKHFYVNPEVPFDPINTKIHGISYQDVMQSPNFIQLWNDELGSIFSDTVAVAHNAVFDLNVLDKCLSRYDFTIDPIDYICTMRTAGELQLCCGSRLSDLCNHYGIPLTSHHNALCDAVACQELFHAMLNDINYQNIEASRFYHSLSNRQRKNSAANPHTPQAFTDLYGIILGIDIDGVITEAELDAFDDWIVRNDKYSNAEPFKSMFRLLNLILKDRIISNYEFDMLLKATRPFVDSNQCSKTTIALQELIGLIRGISIDEQINEEEAFGLRRWMGNHKELKGEPSFDEVFSLLDIALADCLITTDEEVELLDLFEKIINPVDYHHETLCNLSGKKICLTGDFNMGQKSDVESYVASLGGEVVKSVTKKCDYVLVGGKGSERYAFGEYGTKVKKAMDMQDSGIPIKIIQEIDL